MTWRRKLRPLMKRLPETERPQRRTNCQGDDNYTRTHPYEGELRDHQSNSGDKRAKNDETVCDPSRDRASMVMRRNIGQVVGFNLRGSHDHSFGD